MLFHRSVNHCEIPDHINVIPATASTHGVSTAVTRLVQPVLKAVFTFSQMRHEVRLDRVPVLLDQPHCRHTIAAISPASAPATGPSASTIAAPIATVTMPKPSAACLSDSQAHKVFASS